MDNSLSSTNYMRKSLPSRPTDDNLSQSQESGWTLYLEDFMAESRALEDTNSSCCSGSQSSSLVSDHSRKLRDDNDDLMSKRRKIRSSFIDQELEDTASSPVHTPQVNDLNHLYMKYKEMVNSNREACQENELKHIQNEQPEKHNSIGSPQEIGIISHQAGEGIDVGFLETELRRKGLCLVPISMLLNYLR